MRGTLSKWGIWQKGLTKSCEKGNREGVRRMVTEFDEYAGEAGFCEKKRTGTGKLGVGKRGDMEREGNRAREGMTRSLMVEGRIARGTAHWPRKQRMNRILQANEIQRAKRRRMVKWRWTRIFRIRDWQ